MSLPWQDWEEVMKWQTDKEYVPSNFECVACILLTCECVRFSQQYQRELEKYRAEGGPER